MIHADLRADRAVDLSEKRRWDLSVRNPAQERGRDEARGVAHGASTEREHGVVARKALSQELVIQPVDGVEVLVVLSGRHFERSPRYACAVEAFVEPVSVQPLYDRLGNDRDATRTP